MTFVAIYDANVLYPDSLRDLLVRLAQIGLYQAKWTDQILDEMMIDAIVLNQPELADRLQRTRGLMNDAIRDVRVTGYEHLIDGLELPGRRRPSCPCRCHPSQCPGHRHQ